MKAKARAKKYFNYIDTIAGAGRYVKITDEGETLDVAVVMIDDIPEKGEITSFTYGLSFYEPQTTAGLERAAAWNGYPSQGDVEKRGVR